MRQKRVTAGTRDEYERKLTRFRDRLEDVNSAALRRGRRAVLTEAQRKAGQTTSIDYDKLAYEDFEECALLDGPIVKDDDGNPIKDQDGQPKRDRPSFSVLGKWRSAVMHDIREQHASIDDNFRNDISALLTGARKDDAGRKKRGEMETHEKDIIPPVLYDALCDHAIMEGTKTSITALAFMVRQFNIMSRSETVETLSWTVARAKGDNISWRVNQHKGDQEGKFTDDKACFANPEEPKRCLFLATGMFALVFGDRTEVQARTKQQQ